MNAAPPSTLHLPSFLKGTYVAAHRKARKEGKRCGEQYRKDGSFPAPRELLEVTPGELVVTHEVADFQRELPVWRLYMLSSVMEGVCEALDWQNAFQVSDAYEAFCRETAWGALYAAIAQEAPRSAERTALRLKAVLRFWEPLQSARYLFKTLGTVLTLEELMMTSCDWALDSWCPVGDASIRVRLERTADRMAQATRDDCLEAIFREMPRALTYAKGLKHRDRLADAAFLRQRLATLDPASFERVSGACTSDLLNKLYQWDRQLGAQ
jgi:hypothetical protein